MDDIKIIAVVLRGDAAAFRLLVDRHAPLVFSFVRNLIRSHSDAEDLCQETFVAAYRHLATFDPRIARFSTWLLSIARNQCLTLLRRESVQPAGVPVVLSPEPAPDARVSDSELWRALDAALDDLPLPQRTAFVLSEIEQMPYAEIAALESVEIGTVKSRVARARERLRSLLAAFRPEHVPRSRPDLAPATEPGPREVPHEQ